MRPVAIVACLAATMVLLPAVAPSEGFVGRSRPSTRPCAPPGAEVLAADGQAQIYGLPYGSAVYGCGRGAPRRRLGIAAECVLGRCGFGLTRLAIHAEIQSEPPTNCRRATATSCGLLAAWALSGSVVAYEEFHEQPGDDSHELTVLNLRSGRVLHRFVLRTPEWLPGLVVSARGAAAWLQFSPTFPGCYSWGHAGNSCSGTFALYALGSSGSQTLATGLHQLPVLSLDRGMLVWTEEGAVRSTPLP